MHQRLRAQAQPGPRRPGEARRNEPQLALRPPQRLPNTRRVSAAESAFSAGPGAVHFSVDGTPIYRQGDPRWGSRILGRNRTLGGNGCAVTAIAMAISKISGIPISPGELDAHLDRRRGYAGKSGNAVDWNKAAEARGLTTAREHFSLRNIDRHLAQGHPVVVGVDYKDGSEGGANGTDHWVCITSRHLDQRGRPYYLANDPGTGRITVLYPDRRGGLRGDGRHALGVYQTTWQLQTFSPAAAAGQLVLRGR